jgi:Dolichyl-phosphate-mannose-protein mannosyltransferase
MIQFNRVTKSFGPRLSLARHERFWLVGILLVALALRVWDLGARSLWYDEACEYWVAVAPAWELAHFVGLGSGDPPLYAFLLHLWMTLGTHEAWLRALSVLMSLAGVAGLMVLGRRLAGPSAAIAAGLLAAVNPPDIRYAQEVGQYALMLGTVAWSLVALHGLWNEGGRKWVVTWALLAFSATASYYAAVFPVLVPFGCALVEALVRRDRSRSVRFAVALVIYAAVTIPVLWSVLPDQFSRVLVTRERVAEFTQQPEGLALVWRWLTNLFAFHFSGFPSTFVPAWVPVVCWFILLGLALRSWPRWVLWFAAAWAVYGVTAFFELFPMGFRWGMILCPFVVARAAVGVASGARKRWLQPVGVVAFAGLVVAGMLSLPNRTVRDAIGATYSLVWPETEDVRPVVEYWHARRSRSQPTYVFYGAAPAFSYYLQRYPDTRGGLPPVWTLTCWGEEDYLPDFCSRDNIYYGRWIRLLDSHEKVVSVFKTLGSTPPEFWVVFSHVQGAESAEIMQILARAGYTTVDWIERRAAGAVLLQRQ